MAKAPDAFRTISEVADWLDTPAHVLRFWESKFTQIKPVKRAGGRRYYRPEDMELLGGIKTLLHEQGMTIKGVQKLLREQGVRHVASLGPSLDGPADTDIALTATPAPSPQPDTGNEITLPPTDLSVGQNPFASLLASLPAQPAPRGGAPRRRLLALLAGADRPALARNAARLRPYLRQMQDLRSRMGRD